jgi:Flp pilus assembly protein TadG
MRRTNPKQRRSDRRGTTAVEFSLAFPAILVLTFFCFDMARLSMMRNLAHNAAYETARFAMMEGVTQAEATEVAEGVLARLGTQQAVIDINGGQLLSGPMNTVDVSITIPMEHNALILDKVLGLLGFNHKWDNNNIVSELSLRKERYDGFFDTDGV